MSKLFETVLKEYGFIHRDAPDILDDYERLRREIKAPPSKIKQMICDERGISMSTLDSIIADGKERRADRQKMRADRDMGW